MNETLANFTTLNIDDQGLEELVLGDTKFPETLSTQVIEQLVEICPRIRVFKLYWI